MPSMGIGRSLGRLGVVVFERLAGMCVAGVADGAKCVIARGL